MVTSANSKKTVRQIVKEDGTPLKGAATENIWVGYEQIFSKPSEGNKVQAFTTGKEYFGDLVSAFDAAQTEIYITGWQVNWDALVAPNTRLFGVIYRAAKRGVNIYVMPWDDTEPVQTYDDQTKDVLLGINKNLGKKLVHVQLASSMADLNKSFFSHHQKCVIVDRKIAYMGGIDLAYGRYDDASYTLKADAEGRKVLNSYNPGIPSLLKVSSSGVVDPDLLTGSVDEATVPFVKPKSTSDKVFDQVLGGALQVPYTENMAAGDANKNVKDFHTIDPARQPREPWQDVHNRIEGGAVADLLRNFIWRWNSIAAANKQVKLPAAPTADSMGKPGTCSVQVLRSAPAAMRNAESSVLTSAEKASTKSGVQSDIHHAMLLLIEKANRFIYIENQFFVSAFGHVQDAGNPRVLSGPARSADKVDWGLDQTTGAYASRQSTTGSATALPANEVCKALGDRIDKAIRDARNPNFHVYITLPVHPEGSLGKGAVMTQIHWTMQSLAFGSQSLLSRIRRSLKARELFDKKDANWKRAYTENNKEYENIPVESCFKYVTLLNLRNWELLANGRYVTEQIYVHSKLMIVDDRYVLMGSANINDRSLLGSRDSELAVLIMDTEHSQKDVNGQGSNKLVRKFAHDLRKDIWKKIFGITSGVRPAANLKAALDQPGKPESWEMIQKQAEANAKLYEAAFSFVPRNTVKDKQGNPISASIWPVWNNESGKKTGLMPFEEAFWDAPRHEAAAVNLVNLKGFMTALPHKWTEGENNDFGFTTPLMVNNDLPEDANPNAAKPALASAQPATRQDEPAQV